MDGIVECKVDHERGMSCINSTVNSIDYVTFLCTHRPSLLPNGFVGDLLTVNYLTGR